MDTSVPQGRANPGGLSCLTCGQQNPVGNRFCGQCGSPLPLTCPICGQQNPAGNRFCGQCGSPLFVTVPSSMDTSSLTQPTTLSDSKPARFTVGERERRLVTVLFCDLVGFTPLSERLDA
jgi:hypothetical protein